MSAQAAVGQNWRPSSLPHLAQPPCRQPFTPRNHVAQGEIGSGVISDIVQLSGIALNGSSGQTAPFVLQMSYDSDVLPGTSAADDPLYLAWLDPLPACG